jgi:hypothetical protein
MLTLVLLSSMGAFTAGAALAPRTDINPALLYWQAFSIYPVLTNAEAKLLIEPNAGSSEERARLAARFDNSFKLIGRAAQSTAPCDWGVDLADGPEAFVPNVAKIRTGANAALLRAQVALAEGRDEDAVRNLLSIVAMARHTAVQGTLVQAMIQVAIEDMAYKFAAANIGKFDAAALSTLERQLASAPGRKSVADAMQFEKQCFFEWFVKQIEEIRAAHPGNEAAAVKTLWSRLFSDKSFPDLWAQAGQSGAGLIAYCAKTEILYDELLRFASASPAELKPAGNEMRERLDASGNILAQTITPNIVRARTREMETVARLEMVRAAIAFKLRGEVGFRSVRDPFGNGPFAMTPQPEGFELRSQLADYGFKGTLAFGNNP